MELTFRSTCCRRGSGRERGGRGREERGGRGQEERGGRGREESGGRREREKVIESVEKGEGRGRRMEEKGEGKGGGE